MIVAYLYICKFKIEHHQKFCHLFSTSNLTCCKCVALKGNNLLLFNIITVNLPSTLPLAFFTEDQDLQLSEVLERALKVLTKKTDLMYRDIMLILISWWLLNLICSITQALNGHNSSKQNSQPSSPPVNVIWETLFQLLLVFVFTPSLFHFKLYKFLLMPIRLRLHGLQANWIYSIPSL